MPDEQPKAPAPAGAKAAVEEVKLKKPHRHQDRDHVPGDKIKVTQAQKKRLQDRDII